MLTSHSPGGQRHRAFIAALACGATAAAVSTASAHVRLMQPPSWIQESALGDPQKNEPCGTTAAAPGTPTNIVTPFKAGQQITVQWAEEVAHDGWFRIALSYNNRADLKDPTVQVNAQQIAVDASVVDPPVLPILADHLFPHTAASVQTPKAYSYMVTLPMQPCAKCTLQLIQFMGDHGPNGSNTMNAAYIYHHCADISISATSTDGGTPTDAGKDVSIGSGGSAGAGGASTGGGGTGNNAGTGGTMGAGGSSGTSTGGATGSTSTGSTVSTTTGPTGTTTSTTSGSGAGGSSTATPSSSDNGCSCRLASRTPPSMAALGAFVGLALATRRRRRR